MANHCSFAGCWMICAVTCMRSWEGHEIVRKNPRNLKVYISCNLSICGVWKRSEKVEQKEMREYPLSLRIIPVFDATTTTQQKPKKLSLEFHKNRSWRRPGASLCWRLSLQEQSRYTGPIFSNCLPRCLLRNQQSIFHLFHIYLSRVSDVITVISPIKA